MKKRIHFTKHAKAKMAILAGHGFKLTKPEVERVVRTPVRIRAGYEDRKIAEGFISEEYILRVIYEESPRELKIITLYPARRDRYESKL